MNPPFKNINRLLPLLRTILVVTAASLSNSNAADRLPNVVIILTDDQGYADIGKLGAEGFTTPHLDQMANEGGLYRNFHVAQPVCSASRAGLLTGCYPNRIGIPAAIAPHRKVGISDQEVTLAQLLKNRGYATAMLGKWHLGDLPQFMPLKRGFDQFFGLPVSVDYWHHMADYDPNLPPKQVQTKQKYPPLPIYDGEKKFRDEMTPDDLTHLTTWYTERAVKFIHENSSKPFFLYVAHSMPHVPIAVSDKFKGKSQRGLYGDVIEEIDWSVGQILEAIKSNGIDNKTLVIFASDNGPALDWGNWGGIRQTVERRQNDHLGGRDSCPLRDALAWTHPCGNRFDEHADEHRPLANHCPTNRLPAATP